MSPPSPAPGSAADWLARARGELVLAEASLPQGGYLEDLCFFAQQAAELAVKAVYQHFGWQFRFTHDLGDLIDGSSQRGLTIPAEVQDADHLSVFAVQTLSRVYARDKTAIRASRRDCQPRCRLG
jgi:HEPN domain-containing protein